MKKIFSIAALCAAFIAGVSCSKMEQPGSPAEAGTAESGEGNYTVTFECSMADEAVSDATRTEFHDKTIWWSEGDRFCFYQYATVGGQLKARSKSGTSDRSRENLVFKISFDTPDPETKAAYFSVFPYESAKATSVNSGIVYPRITLPATQKPTEENFDPKSDILISKYVYDIAGDDEGKITVPLEFTRPSAIGKMTIKNLPSSSNLASIKFSAKKGGKAVALTGSHYYDLVKGEVSSLTSSTVKDTTELVLDYSEKTIAANESMTAYFCCYPFELGSGDSFKVVVTTKDGEVFTKDVTIPSGRTLELVRGKGTKFSVDMASAVKGYTWLTISSENPSNYSEGSHKILAQSFTCTTGTVTSMSYKRVLASDYWEAVEKGTVDELYTEMTNVAQSSLGNLNNGKKVSYTFEPGSIIPDADYYVLVKLTDSSKGEIKTAGLVHSEPFAFLTSISISSYTSGQFGHKFYGAGIKSIQYIAVESSKIEGGLSNANCQKYFEENIADAESISSTTIGTINSRGAAGYGYLKVSTTFSSGVECVDLVLATMTDGTTKFCWKKQNAKN